MFTNTNNRHTRRFHRRISNHIHISIYKSEGSLHKLQGLGNKIMSARKTKYERSELLMRAPATNEIPLKKGKSCRSAGCQRQTESIWEMLEFKIIFVLA